MIGQFSHPYSISPLLYLTPISFCNRSVFSPLLYLTPISFCNRSVFSPLLYLTPISFCNRSVFSPLLYLTPIRFCNRSVFSPLLVLDETACPIKYNSTMGQHMIPKSYESRIFIAQNIVMLERLSAVSESFYIKTYNYFLYGRKSSFYQLVSSIM